MKRILAALLLFSQLSFSQQSKIDSIHSLLQHDTQDTSKIDHFNALSYLYINIGNYDSALYNSEQSIDLIDLNLGIKKSSQTDAIRNIQPAASNLKLLSSLANAFNNMGLIYYYQGDFSRTLEYWKKALEIDEKLNDKTGIAKRLGNIGIVYDSQSDFPKALDYYLKALKLDEELKDKDGIAHDFGNIGVVYRAQSNYTKALEYYFKALKIDEEIGDESGVGRHLSNIGLVYSDQNENAKALEYFFKALKIAEKLGDKQKYATIYNNIGIVYDAQTDYNKAFDSYKKALDISKEIGDQTGVTRTLSNIAANQLLLKKYKNSFDYIYPALALADSIGELNYVKENYFILSDLYEKSTVPLPDTVGGKLLNMEQMRLRSKYYFKKYFLFRDSLFSEENKKQITQKEMNFEFEKKEEITKAEHEKQIALDEEDKKRQQLYLYLIAAIAAATLIIAFLIFKSLRVTRKQKNIIETQKTEVEHAKSLVEEKNKDITDSIHYARRIQRALLASDHLLKKNLPEFFVLYKPKDIVSGDFYWAQAIETERADSNFLLCAGDCTGHGVPGAFMSLLNISLLNEAVTEKKIISPDQILNHVRARIISSLNPSSSETGIDDTLSPVYDMKDGMDCVLCSFDFKNKTLQFAAANNPLWLIRENKMEVFSPDKMPVGMYEKEPKPFTLQQIQLIPGDLIYIFTDGYADQFGGEKGKKFKYKQMQEKIDNTKHLPMLEQKKILDETIEKWKGDLEQVDDILVIGIRV